MEAGKKTQQFNAELSQGEEDKVLEQLKADGCNVVDVTDKGPGRKPVPALPPSRRPSTSRLTCISRFWT